MDSTHTDPHTLTIHQITDLIKANAPTINTNRKTEKKTSIEVLRLFSDEWKLYRRGGKTNPEDGTVLFHPNGDITLATLWDTHPKVPGNKAKKDKYAKFLSILQPEENHYHECATEGKYHPRQVPQMDDDGQPQGPSRFAKHLAVAGKACECWQETLSHYLNAMNLG